MKTVKYYVSVCFVGMGLLFGSCDKEGHINIMSVQDDIKLGQQVSDEIAKDPATYPILDSAQYPAAYGHIHRITNEILDKAPLNYRNEFAWKVKLIRDDKTLNAFATPGGYIYVYTGLIKYLDTEDQLAGVMGHEIAHADKRHTSRNITREYGVDVVLQVVLGNDQGTLVQIAKGLASLSYSRDFESEADAASVDYLAKTKYQCNGAAGFFEKLISQGQAGGTPQFLSTHPNPDNRVAAINGKADTDGCNKTPSTGSNYQAFKSSLP